MKSHVPSDELHIPVSRIRVHLSNLFLTITVNYSLLVLLVWVPPSFHFILHIVTSDLLWHVFN